MQFFYTLLNVKTVLFQAIRFSVSTQFKSIWPLDRTLSGATTQGQSGPGSNGNKVVLSIAQSIAEAAPLDCLVSYLGHSLEESYPSAVYSAAPADWAKNKGGDYWYREKGALNDWWISQRSYCKNITWQMEPSRDTTALGGTFFIRKKKHCYFF